MVDYRLYFCRRQKRTKHELVMLYIYKKKWHKKFAMTGFA